MVRSKMAAQVPREVQIVEAYLTVSMAVLNEVGLGATEKVGVQVFVLGLVDRLRHVKAFNWDQFIAAYEFVLSKHNLMPAVPVDEFVKSVGATASENTDIDTLMRLAAQSISLYVSKRDVGAPDDLLSAPRFAQEHAASFAPLCSSSGTSETCSSRERQCIRLASDAMREIDKRRLGELYTQRFESPLSGVAFWPKGDKKLSAFLLLPIAWGLIIILAISVPVMYVLHRIDVRRATSALRRQICDPPDATEVAPPSKKTLEALWESCALPGGLSLDESSALVSNWLSVLYGEKVANSVNAEARARQIAKEQAEANRPYYDGDEDAPHFYFALPIESLIRELTDELPPYSEQA